MTYNNGEMNPASVMTERQVAEIKARLAAGQSGKSIAEMYGVANSTISYIKNGTMWKHVAAAKEITGPSPKIARQELMPRRSKDVYEFLLTQCAPGYWFYPNYKAGYAQCSMKKEAFRSAMRRLERFGFIEMRIPISGRPCGREVRVIRKIVNDEIVAIEVLRDELERRQSKPKPRKLIRYAGWEGGIAW